MYLKIINHLLPSTPFLSPPPNLSPQLTNFILWENDLYILMMYDTAKSLVLSNLQCHRPLLILSLLMKN